MRHLLVWCEIAVVCAGAMGSSLLAQHTLAEQSQGTRAVATRDMAVMARPVTVQLENVSLMAALNDVAVAARVKIQYRTDVLEAITRPVTVRAVRMPLGEVLEQLLDQTDLYAIPTAAQLVTVKQMPGAKAPSVAQGVVIGKVTHAKTKRPVVGATVILNDVSQGVTTGDDGTFRLTAAAGEHTIHVRAVGFVRQSKRIAISGDEASVLEFILEPSASVLDEVIVTGTVVATERKTIPNPITVITAEDIANRGITRIEQLFRGEIPGVLALDRGSQIYDGYLASSMAGAIARSQVVTRGASQLTNTGSNPLKTYIDGVEMLDPNYLGTIDPQSIERIEIIAGPQAATVYGSGAMGGVMQIFTKRGSFLKKPEVSATLKYGTLENNLRDGLTPKHSHTLNVSGGVGNQFSYAASTSYNYTGKWQPGLFARQIGASLGATYVQGAVTGNASIATTMGKNGTYDGEWLFALPILAELVRQGELGVSSGYQGVNRASISSSQTVAVTLDYKAGTFGHHTVTAGRNGNTFELDDQALTLWAAADTMYRAAMSNGLRTTLGYTASFQIPAQRHVSLSLAFGANGSWGSNMYVRGCRPNPTSTVFTTCTYAGGSLSASKTMADESWGGFGRWQMGLFDRLHLTFGLRAERNPAYGQAHKIDWTPNNGVAYTEQVGAFTFKLFGSYGRATRAPTPAMRLSTMTTSSAFDPSTRLQQLEAPDLTPEYSRGPQGGIELYFGSLASLTINHYNQKVTDLIQSVRADSILITQLSTGSQIYAPIGQYVNAATIRQQGWELTGAANVWRLALKGTYTWSDTRVLAVHPTLSSNAWGPGYGAFGIPTHTGFVSVGYAFGGTSINYSLNYVGTYTRANMGDLQDEYYDYGRLKMYNERGRFRTNKMNHLPGYTKGDLAISHRLRPRISMTLHVNNVANSYESDASFRYANLGRQTMMGLQIRR